MTEHQHTTVAVTGATGFVGRRVLERVLESGRSARVLARGVDRARGLFEGDGLDLSRVEIVEGSLSDPDALARLVRGADAAIHLVGIIREAKGGQTFERVHVEGTKAVLHACAGENPSMRYVQMSALGIGPDERAGYRDSKHKAEQAVRASKLGWTIVRPGLIFGARGEFTQMAAAWVRGKAPPFVFLPYFSRKKQKGFGFEAPRIAPVFVKDVADAFVGCLDKPQSVGETIELSGGGVMTFPEMLNVYQRHVPGAKGWLRPLGLPWKIAALQARAAGAVALGSLLPFDEGMAIMGGRDSVADLSKARELLGFDPAPFEETLKGFASEL